MEDIDYGQDTKPTSSDDLARLSQLGNDLRDAEAEIERREAALKQAQNQFRYISETAIPELMKSLGLVRFETTSGAKIELGEVVSATITQANKPKAFEWLEKNGHGGMIKRMIVVLFNREQEDAANDLQNDLRPKYPGVTQEKNVHSSTLKAWVTRRLAAGEAIPPSISVEVISRAKLA